MTEETKRRFVYIGRVMPNKGNKLVHGFAREDNLNSYVYWEKAKAQRFAGAIIGKIYEIGDTLPSSFLWSDCCVGQVDDDTRMQLQIESKTAERVHAQSRIDPNPELKAIVRKLGIARWKLGPAQKAAFDAWVLNEMRKV